MAILEKEVQERIDELRFGANQFFLTDKKKYFSMKEKAWELYPTPKEQWNEAYSLAKDFYQDYLYQNNLEQAKKWLNRMIENNNNLHLFDEDCSFEVAKYHFETKKFEEALELFKYVAGEAGLRYFEGEDPKYLDFYKNPEKYMK